MKHKIHKTDNKKKELLISKINRILEVLSEADCQRIYDLISKLYLSWQSIKSLIKLRTTFLCPFVSIE